MTRQILSFSAILLGLAATSHASYDVATFADTGLPLTSAGLPNGVGGQYNNSSGGFYSGGQYFNNTYHSAYGGYWNGFAVSTTTSTTVPGYTNQYSSITGSGNGDAYYAVLYPSAYVNLTGNVQSIDLTNTTYAYLSMMNGDSFENAFTTGSYFKVVITGYSGLGATGAQTGSVTSTLANYTSPSSSPLNTWNTVDLTSLGSAESIGFSFLSSATGQYGINTPEYVAVDNLVVSPSFVPEPSSWLLCVTGIGMGAGAIVRRRRLARITDV